MSRNMVYGKRIFPPVAFAAALMFAACGNGGADAEAQIDALELEGLTHVTLTLAEDLEVDASVTPYEKYKDGVTVYYAGNYIEGESGSGVSAEDEDATIFGKNASEQFRLLVEYLGEDFNTATVTPLDTYYRCISCLLDGDEDREICVSWSDITDGYLWNPDLGYPWGGDSGYGNMLNHLVSDLDVSACSPQAYGDEIAEAAEEGKELVAELTGQEMADTNLCIPLTEAGDDVYAFVYPFALDGFPWNFETLGIQLDASVEVTAEAQERFFTNDGITASLSNLYYCPARIYYADGKPVEVDIPQYVSVREPYQENAAVINARDALKLTVDYFDKVLVEDKVVIDSIELAYNVYATDGSDGEVRFTAAPFWYVRYREGDGGSRYLIFLAQTGECLGVRNYAL